MRGLTATLAAAQRSNSAAPHLLVQVLDRRLNVPNLRWTRWYSGAEADGACAAAVNGSGGLIRARIEAGSPATLYSQLVGAPGPGSDYSAWTSEDSCNPDPRLGLAALGTRALLTYVAADGVTVRVVDSNDGGASFAAGGFPTVVVAGSTVTAVTCAVSDSSGSAVVFYAVGGVVSLRYREGLGPWVAGGSWPHALSYVNGLVAWEGDVHDFDLLVSGYDSASDYHLWHTAYGVGYRYTPGDWPGPRRLAFAPAATSVTFLATGLTHAGAPRATYLERIPAAAPDYRAHAITTLNGDFFGFEDAWRGDQPLGYASEYGVGIASLYGSTHAYLATPAGVWHTDVTTGLADISADVLECTYEQHHDQPGNLRLVLDNSGGQHAETAAQPGLDPGNTIWVSPGYHTTEGAESSAGPAFTITRVTRQRGPGRSVVIVEGTDFWGELATWHPDRQLTWPDGPITQAGQILNHLHAAAGVRTIGGVSTESQDLEPAAFTVPIGMDGAAATRRLLALIPDHLRPDHRGFDSYEPLPGDAADYAYGAPGAEFHAISAVEVTSARPQTGWARVFGATHYAEAVDDTAVERGASVLIVNDDKLIDQDRVDARAVTTLRRSVLRTPRGRVTVPVNAGQELGDVVALTDGTLGLDAALLRVQNLRLRFNRQPAGAGRAPLYDLTLELTDL